jgi:hypothetical protein
LHTGISKESARTPASNALWSVGLECGVLSIAPVTATHVYHRCVRATVMSFRLVYAPLSVSGPSCLNMMGTTKLKQYKSGTSEELDSGSISM